MQTVVVKQKMAVNRNEDIFPTHCASCQEEQENLFERSNDTCGQITCTHYDMTADDKEVLSDGSFPSDGNDDTSNTIYFGVLLTLTRG